ncbi:hypothetical protein G8Y83_06840, partial [Staphylococcus sp. 10602379]|nr:hypothetical protein [Staphylococcus sp. 10602379]
SEDSKEEEDEEEDSETEEEESTEEDEDSEDTEDDEEEEKQDTALSVKEPKKGFWDKLTKNKKSVKIKKNEVSKEAKGIQTKIEINDDTVSKK